MTNQEFEQILKDMKPRSVAFDLVKREMKKRGHWKNKARGGSFKKPSAKRAVP